MYILQAWGGWDNERRGRISDRRYVPGLRPQRLSSPGRRHGVETGRQGRRVRLPRETGVSDHLGLETSLDRRGGDQWRCRGAAVCWETVGGTKCVLRPDG